MQKQDKRKVKNDVIMLDILPDPIELTIWSPDCPDLTIIDLPGITLIPLKDSD